MVKTLWGAAGTAVVGGALVLTLSGTAAAQAEGKCVAGKLKCVTGYATGLVGCLSKDAVKPSQTTLDACFAKVGLKWNDPVKGSCFGKVEAKPPCNTTGDLESLDSIVTAYEGQLRAALDPSAPPSTLNKCLSGKFKCATNLVKGLLGCEGKNVVKPDAVALGACLSKVLLKFNDPVKGCFPKLDAAGSCVTAGDAAAQEDRAELLHRDVALALGCGDGVVSTGEACDDDNRTEGDGCSSACDVEVCGDGELDFGESCDDGNANDLDACPNDCVIDACSGSGTPQQVTVNWNAPASVGGLTVVVDYPEGKLLIPGSGGGAQASFANFPAGTSSQVNDFDHATLVTVVKATAIVPRPGILFRINGQTCTGQPAPTAGEFTCSVTSAVAVDGVTPVAGATCTVTVP